MFSPDLEGFQFTLFVFVSFICKSIYFHALILILIFISVHLQPNPIAPPNCNPKDCVTGPLKKCRRLADFAVPYLRGPATKTATAIAGPPDQPYISTVRMRMNNRNV